MPYGIIPGGVSFNPDTDIKDLSEKVIFITGGNRGIGFQTALALAKHNPSHIYISARNQANGDSAVATITDAVPDARVTFLPCDLTDLDSVTDCAREFLQREKRLDLLFLNAGIMVVPPGLTKQGYEVQFGTNHVGHFLLTKLLLPTLRETAARPGSDVRIVSVSSLAHTMGFIAFAELRTDMHKWFSMRRYAQSKLANILLAKQLARNFETEGSGILAVAIHPGIVETGLYESEQKKIPGIKIIQKIFRMFPSIFFDAPTGAKTQLWAATAERAPKNIKALDKEALGKVVNGEYYSPIGEAGQGSAQTENEELAKKLWDWSEEELKDYTLSSSK